MLSFHGGLKIFLAIEPCDMRRGFNGLFALAQNQLNEDPLDGGLFIFSNKKRNRIKVLYFDGTGLWVLAKRLEKGKFSWPLSTGADQTKLRLAPEALQLLMDGVDLKQATMRAWYER
jgi:transposase